MTRGARSTGSRLWRIGLVVGGSVVAVLGLANFTMGQQDLEWEIPGRYPVRSPDFLRAMGIALGPSIVGGNRVVALQNGDEIFPAMLQAIRSAQHTITFETYVYWTAEIGRQFAEALAERARAGVKVHVLTDWVGSNQMDQSYIGTMQQAGVAFRKFRPLRIRQLTRLNNRTHRKLLVVDGRIGFTGGVGIAGAWMGHAQDPEHWRDSHFQVEGPVVAQLQAAFMDNWTETTGEVLHGAQYFPALDSVGTSPAQVFSSSPNGGGESMELMYLLAITAAEQSIQLSSAYFVPNAPARTALAAAARRGVKVQIITPGPHIDAETARRASRDRWGDLLAAGVEIFEYQPTMYHMKMMIVDELLVSVGSTNFDPRSFRYNDEANLNIYDGAFALSQLEVFRRDLSQARRVTLAEWRSRPWREKLIERLAGLLGPAL